MAVFVSGGYRLDRLMLTDKDLELLRQDKTIRIQGLDIRLNKYPDVWYGKKQGFVSHEQWRKDSGHVKAYRLDSEDQIEIRQDI